MLFASLPARVAVLAAATGFFSPAPDHVVPGVAKVDQLGYRTSYSYGRYQNELTMQNPLGYVWSRLYDNMGYQTGAIDPLGNQTTTVFNAAKQQIASIDALGFATSFF